MENLTSANFDVKTKGVCIVDFWAEWCGPCKMLGPVFEELSRDYRNVKFFKLNTDEASDIAEKFNVMSIPCLIVMKDGQETGRIVGFMSKDSLKRKIDGVLG